MYMRYYDSYPALPVNKKAEIKEAAEEIEVTKETIETSSSPEMKIASKGSILNAFKTDDIILLALLFILLFESDDIIMLLIIGYLLLGEKLPIWQILKKHI